MMLLLFLVTLLFSCGEANADTRSLDSLYGDFLGVQEASLTPKSNGGGTFAFYPSQLTRVVQVIYRSSECRELLARVSQEGPVGIRAQSLGFGAAALWDGGSRTIILNSNKRPSEGEQIATIIFELHNAATNERLTGLWNRAISGKISKEDYVEAVENLEYQNLLKTVKLLERETRSGILPRNICWRAMHTFEDHYKLQQLCGHSSWIADSYDKLNPREKRLPYQGTLGLTQLDARDREVLLRYLSIKDLVESPRVQERSYGEHLLRDEMASITGRAAHRVKNHCIELLGKIFHQPLLEKVAAMLRAGGISFVEKG